MTISRRVSPIRRHPINPRRVIPRRVSVIRSLEYRAFLCEHGWCAGCHYIAAQRMLRDGYQYESVIRGVCDPAHTTNNGMGSKGGDDTCAPLCRVHHMEYDRGRDAFERKYIINMRDWALVWWEMFQRRRV